MSLDRGTQCLSFFIVPGVDTGFPAARAKSPTKLPLFPLLPVLPRGLNQRAVFLAMVLGGAFGSLAIIGFCIFCCVRCRHQQVSEHTIVAPWIPKAPNLVHEAENPATGFWFSFLCLAPEAPHCRPDPASDPTRETQEGTGVTARTGGLNHRKCFFSASFLPSPLQGAPPSWRTGTLTTTLLVPGQRQAARMSQIKKLLSEKKTCQCSQ